MTLPNNLIVTSTNHSVYVAHAFRHVPDMVKHDDIDQAAELVDLGRILTSWLFDKETM
jgi:hypothetical protein